MADLERWWYFLKVGGQLTSFFYIPPISEESVIYIRNDGTPGAESDPFSEIAGRLDRVTGIPHSFKTDKLQGNDHFDERISLDVSGIIEGYYNRQLKVFGYGDPLKANPRFVSMNNEKMYVRLSSFSRAMTFIIDDQILVYIARSVPPVESSPLPEPEDSLEVKIRYKGEVIASGYVRRSLFTTKNTTVANMIEDTGQEITEYTLKLPN